MEKCQRGRYDFLVVGAGLFGCTFARLMTDAGYRCVVVERRSRPGGNIACSQVEGITVHDYGPHIFHTSDKSIWDFVRRYADFHDFVNTPLALSGGRLYNLPFNLNTFRQLWGCTTEAEARARVDEQCAAAWHALREQGIDEPRNLEERALTLVGRDVYQTLIKHYTQKQWGRPCAELPAWIIKRLPLRFTADNNYYDDTFQGIPDGGYNVLIELLLDGIEVQCGCDYYDNRAYWDAVAPRRLVTGRIDRYYDYCYGRLDFRGLRFETEVLSRERFQDVAVVNYCDAQPQWTRIVEHKHFAPISSPLTVITHEYPAECRPGDEPYYPINDERNDAIYRRYAARAAADPAVIFGGRLGSYRYADMAPTIAAATALVHKILTSDKSD